MLEYSTEEQHDPGDEGHVRPQLLENRGELRNDVNQQQHQGAAGQENQEDGIDQG